MRKCCIKVWENFAAVFEATILVEWCTVCNVASILQVGILVDVIVLLLLSSWLGEKLKDLHLNSNQIYRENHTEKD